MFINCIAHYLPETKLSNSYFSELTGLDESEILKKSGITERRKAGPHENTNTMGVNVVTSLIREIPFPITDIDLIIGATYTPYDMVGTLAHAVQRKFCISGAKAVSVSSACSSFVNAVEIAQTYFAAGKASKALVVVSEHNSAYNDEKNVYSGFLWGDGAAGVVISNTRYSAHDVEIIDVETTGLADVGKGTEAVYQRPLEDRIQMHDGKDVFINASKYMTQNTLDILQRNKYSIDDLTYLIPHQANIRIINKVSENLGKRNGNVLTNINYLGNTGCASAAIALSENWQNFASGNLMVISVFGGGYSSGSMLLKKL